MSTKRKFSSKSSAAEKKQNKSAVDLPSQPSSSSSPSQEERIPKTLTEDEAKSFRYFDSTQVKQIDEVFRAFPELVSVKARAKVIKDLTPKDLRGSWDPTVKKVSAWVQKFLDNKEWWKQESVLNVVKIYENPEDKYLKPALQKWITKHGLDSECVDYLSGFYTGDHDEDEDAKDEEEDDDRPDTLPFDGLMCWDVMIRACLARDIHHHGSLQKVVDNTVLSDLHRVQFTE